jgi:uncharacterized protein (UPF0248 family)
VAEPADAYQHDRVLLRVKPSASKHIRFNKIAEVDRTIDTQFQEKIIEMHRGNSL